MADNNIIKLEVVTPNGAVFAGEVDSLTVPAAAGSTGVLVNHAPLLTVLAPGVIVYHVNGTNGKIAVSTGFMEVNANEARVLVRSAEKAEDINRERAQASADRARQRLAEKAADTDIARAQASLARAMARLKAAE